jgi:hypothetical protein
VTQVQLALCSLDDCPADATAGSLDHGATFSSIAQPLAPAPAGTQPCVALLTSTCGGAEPTHPLGADPLGSLEEKSERSKGYLRTDFFSFYQQSKPAVVLALVAMCAAPSFAPRGSLRTI